jgi:hypothetical protein
VGTKQNALAALSSMLDSTPPAACASVYVATYEYQPNPNGNLRYTFPAIYSYGPHHPLAILDTRSRDIYVNSGTPSKTTATHRAGVRDGLKARGYRPNGIVWVLKGESFEGWTLDKA